LFSYFGSGSPLGSAPSGSHNINQGFNRQIFAASGSTNTQWGFFLKGIDYTRDGTHRSCVSVARSEALFWPFSHISRSATVVEKHETQKKRSVGSMAKSGNRAAALDAMDATLASWLRCICARRVEIASRVMMQGLPLCLATIARFENALLALMVWRTV
jgi:hypothetical protein